MARRSSAGVIRRPLLLPRDVCDHEDDVIEPEGVTTLTAVTRWPTWGGSNVPPNNPIRSPPLFPAPRSLAPAVAVWTGTESATTGGATDSGTGRYRMSAGVLWHVSDATEGLTRLLQSVAPHIPPFPMFEQGSSGNPSVMAFAALDSSVPHTVVPRYSRFTTSFVPTGTARAGISPQMNGCTHI